MREPPETPLVLLFLYNLADELAVSIDLYIYYLKTRYTVFNALELGLRVPQCCGKCGIYSGLAHLGAHTDDS